LSKRKSTGEGGSGLLGKGGGKKGKKATLSTWEESGTEKKRTSARNVGAPKEEV